MCPGNGVKGKKQGLENKERTPGYPSPYEFKARMEKRPP